MTATVRGLRAPDGVRTAISTHLRKQSQIGERVMSHVSLSERWHLGAVSRLADAVDALDLDDHRLVALTLANLQIGGTKLAYSPGTEQVRLVARLGLDAPATEADSALNELVAAAMQDVIEDSGRRVAAAVSSRDDADVLGEKLHREVKRADEAQAAAGKAQSEADQLGAQVGQLIQERDFLLAGLEDRVGSTKARKKTTTQPKEA